MERIQGQAVDQSILAFDVLSWLTFAKESLITIKLQHSLATYIGHVDLKRSNIPDVQDIVSVCAGLVTVDKESDIIRLVHYTTQQYFKREQKRCVSNAEYTITATCITYLSFDVFGSGPCRTKPEYSNRLSLYQLYPYAARYWTKHARAFSSLPPEVGKFLRNRPKLQ